MNAFVDGEEHLADSFNIVDFKFGVVSPSGEPHG